MTCTTRPSTCWLIAARLPTLPAPGRRRRSRCSSLVMRRLTGAVVEQRQAVDHLARVLGRRVHRRSSGPPARPRPSRSRQRWTWASTWRGSSCAEQRRRRPARRGSRPAARRRGSAASGGSIGSSRSSVISWRMRLTKRLYSSQTSSTWPEVKASMNIGAEARPVRRRVELRHGLALLVDDRPLRGAGRSPTPCGRSPPPRLAASGRARSSRSASRSRLALNEPHRPLSEVITTSHARGRLAPLEQRVAVLGPRRRALAEHPRHRVGVRPRLGDRAPGRGAAWPRPPSSWPW